VPTKTSSLESSYADHGIVTDLGRLLRSRHWAQHLKLFSRQAARSNLRSRFRGRGMEFEEVRRYQPGDDIRTIDWKVSARVGETYTKLFCEERERPCHIIVDQRRHLFFGSKTQFKSVLAAELAAAIAWAALAGGDRVGGQVLGDYSERDCRARRNKQAVLKLIHDTHEFNQALLEQTDKPLSESANATTLANSLEECRRITRPGTAIFVLSDFHDFDQAAAKALSELGRHTDITLLQVIDELEQQLPFTGSIAISDGSQNARVRVSNKIKQSYHSKLAERQVLLKSAAAQARALYAELDNAETARQCLRTLFSA